MSLVELYSIESEFLEKKKEYILLMDSIHFSCLGKEKTSSECLKAASLNADMQTCLIKMSNLTSKYPPSSKSLESQQLNLLQLSDTLNNDMKMLLTDSGLQEDTFLSAQMNKSLTLFWGIIMLYVLALVFYLYKKI